MILMICTKCLLFAGKRQSERTECGEEFQACGLDFCHADFADDYLPIHKNRRYLSEYGVRVCHSCLYHGGELYGDGHGVGHLRRAA